MVKKLAIDWDEAELRLIVANCGASSVKVTSAETILLEGREIVECMSDAISRLGLEKTDTYIAIGRDKAEIRDLLFPPVPNDELPDMVRFKAVTSFASAGDSATIDYLPSGRTERNVDVIAAAVAPAKLDAIRDLANRFNLNLKRIALRPVAAAGLYTTRNAGTVLADDYTVLIDLLRNDAEVVIIRGRDVKFLRTVRMPANPDTVPAALASELKRSLISAGVGDKPTKVIVWGCESVHRDEMQQISKLIDSDVEALNPFDSVSIDASGVSELPQHCGRLAPLLGLLVCDGSAPDRLIDFLNPRKRIEAPPDRIKPLLMVGVPLAAVLLGGFLVYRQFSTLDSQIELLKKEIASLEPDVKDARKSSERTGRVDQFLDADVNWLDQFQHLSQTLPPATKLIVGDLNGASDLRAGGGSLTITGAVTDPEVIKELESSVRDDDHQVVSQGSSKQANQKVYLWSFTEAVLVNGETVRSQRYAGLAPKEASESSLPEAETPAAEADPKPVETSDPPASDSRYKDKQPTAPESQV